MVCDFICPILQMKKYKESVADCDAALRLDENYLKAILRRAASRMELEEFDAAVADYDKAHRMDRSNVETRRLLQVFSRYKGARILGGTPVTVTTRFL